MKQKLYYLCFLALLAVTICSVQGVPYHYMTEHEVTPLGERVRFFSGDSVWGPIRSNDSLHIMQRPYFNDYVITSGIIVEGLAANPVFAGPIPVEFAPELESIHTTAWVTGNAQDQGHYYDNGENDKALVWFGGLSMHYCWGVQGEPFDSTQFTEVTLSDSAFIYFDCPVEIWGMVSSVIVFGAADIGLADDVYYTSLDFADDYAIPESATEKLVLVSEKNIKILNTPANGRENEAEGSSIVICGLLVALDDDSGHFTFDQQNDTWDTYQGPTPDERGRIHLRGGVYQKYRGYVHRSNHGGTGYLKDYQWDARLRYWDLPIFLSPDFEITPANLNFGDVVINTIRLDSVLIELDHEALIDVPWVSGLFDVNPIYTFDSLVYIRVIFAPYLQDLGTHTIEIPYYIEGNRYTFTVSATAVLTDEASEDFILQPSSFSLSAFPNPFNPETTIRFTSANSETVSLAIYNTSGQLVQTLANDTYTTGEHIVQFDGAALPSGVYFALLRSSQHTATHKLLLLK